MIPYNFYRLSQWAYAAIGLMLCFTPLRTHAADTSTKLQPTQAYMRLSYETLRLPAGERMGMLEQSVLFDVAPHITTGLGFYSALTGKRGGFITLGFVGETHHELWQPELQANAGIFLGAGGGRGGFQLSGGGLVIRSHFGLNYQLDTLGKLGVGMSYTTFPDGSIHSSQPYINYDLPFTTAYIHGWLQQPPQQDTQVNIRDNQQNFSPIYRHYTIPSGVKTDTGQIQYPMIGLLGIVWTQALHSHTFFKFETEGAFRGKSHGYMQILTGLGYRIPLSDSTDIKLALAAGVAGGGGVDTGGGLLLDSNIGIQQKLGDQTFLELTAGYVQAPGQTFKAQTLSVQLGQHFATPDVPSEGINIQSLKAYHTEDFRLRAIHQSYLRNSPAWRTHHANLNMDNLGIQLDYFLSPYTFITGHTVGAYKGMGGAYMTGMLGAGIHLPLMNTSLFLEAEALGGAAGGGGVAVNGGMVWQARASLGIELGSAYELLLGYGRMESPKGNFKAKVISAELAYKFSIFTR